MWFGRKKSPHSPDPQRNESKHTRNAPGSSQTFWLDLAKIEQEVAELAHAVASRQSQAAQLWESTGEAERTAEAKGAGSTALALEREALQLAEAALLRAKGELRNGEQDAD